MSHWRSAQFALFVILISMPLILSVSAEEQVVADTTVTVRSLSYYSIQKAIDLNGIQGARLRGNIASDSGEISFYIMEEGVFNQWTKSSSDASGSIFRADKITRINFDVAVRKSGVHYLVLDNTFSLLTSKTVTVKASMVFERLIFGMQPNVIYAAAGGIVAAVIAVVAFLLVRKSRSGHAHSHSAQHAAATETMMPKYCASCGAQMPTISVICAKCGQETR